MSLVNLINLPLVIKFCKNMIIRPCNFHTQTSLLKYVQLCKKAAILEPVWTRAVHLAQEVLFCEVTFPLEQMGEKS